MGTHGDAIQRAVVLRLAVVGALLHGAFDAVVRLAFVHDWQLLSSLARELRREIMQMHDFCASRSALL